MISDELIEAVRSNHVRCLDAPTSREAVFEIVYLRKRNKQLEAEAEARTCQNCVQSAALWGKVYCIKHHKYCPALCDDWRRDENN